MPRITRPGYPMSVTMFSRIPTLLLLAWALSGKDLPGVCGTHLGRTQEETFLHSRHLLERARSQAALASGARAAVSTNKDIGNIAVIDDSGGVIGRRNAFDLDLRTLIFTPAATGYFVEAGADAFADAGGDALALGDDDTKQVFLPFPFQFFGADYREAWVNSNGTVTFGRGDTDFSGSFGHFVAGPPVIAALFTDLDPSQSGSIRFLAGSDRVVITWTRVPLVGRLAAASFQTFQIRLYPSGRIELAYRGANPPGAVVGVSPGSLQPVDLAHFSSSSTYTRTYTRGVAETFSAVDAVDIAFAAQRFYQTHEDAYDFLVFYNASEVSAGSGVVAYEMTVRSRGSGYGDTPINLGAELGSKRRLQAVLNMGPVGQYPLNPEGIVTSRMPIGDTPLSLLGHEAGHLALALVSVPDPSNPQSLPMLGSANAHWSFPFNSEASFLGGERIEDRGAGASPRFSTTATVQQYSPLDQYLLGFRPPEEVPPTFVVLNSGQPLTRVPQAGIGFNGNRLDISVNDLVKRYGRRTPDSTVAQRRFRFAFVLIAPAGADPSLAVAQIEEYRRAFEPFFSAAAEGRAVAETSLKRSATLSLTPNAGVLEGAEGTASIELSEPAPAEIRFALRKPGFVLLAPDSVTIPAGASRATFPVFGGRRGVEELTAESSDAAYETAVARVQVNPASALHVSLLTANPLLVRVEDVNGLPYARVSVNGAQTAEDGTLNLQLGSAPLTIAIDGAATPPAIDPGGVVDALSYRAGLTPGGYVSVFGQRLAGSQVKINGTAVPVLYTSDRQVNFLAPASILPGPAYVSLETSYGIAISSAQFALGN
jgi:hypothetical protein